MAAPNPAAGTGAAKQITYPATTLKARPRSPRPPLGWAIKPVMPTGPTRTTSRPTPTRSQCPQRLRRLPTDPRSRIRCHRDPEDFDFDAQPAERRHVGASGSVLHRGPQSGLARPTRHRPGSPGHRPGRRRSASSTTPTSSPSKGAGYRLRRRGIDSLPSIRTTTDETGSQTVNNRSHSKRPNRPVFVRLRHSLPGQHAGRQELPFKDRCNRGQP